MASAGNIYDKYLVPPKDLQVPEYCYRTGSDFNIKPKDDAGVKDFKAIITGLLNTSGGVVSFYSLTGHVDNITLDKWRRDYMVQLEHFLPKDVYMTCIKLVRVGSPVLTLNVLVKRSSQLITETYGLHIRKDTSNHQVTDHLTAHSVLTATPESFGTLRIAHPLVYGAVTHLNESLNTEFKCWKTNTVNEIIFRLYDDRTQNSIFALLNSPTGGNLVIGIKEDEQARAHTVIGQVLKEADEGTLTAAVDKLLKEGRSGEPRIWSKQGSPVQGQDWDISYIPVTGQYGSKRRVLVWIELKQHEGGVFKHQPLSYRITTEGHVEVIGIEDWKQQIGRGAAKATHPVKMTPQRQQRHFTATRAIAAQKAGDEKSKSEEVTQTEASVKQGKNKMQTVLKKVHRLSYSADAQY